MKWQVLLLIDPLKLKDYALQILMAIFAVFLAKEALKLFQEKALLKAIPFILLVAVCGWAVLDPDGLINAITMLLKNKIGA